ncbi:MULTISPECIES: phosphatase PAP2 family protein [unclassified Mesorhizobium]|uniref:phosphatase PAP2 family protein n=1 Tax=unclassified Mesorhizobium TaxID=325217 RepID=UPI002415579B|nr:MULTISPECIES: phosphatase PAP2 family protein [unclassified Mesorhizobium]MDG4853674.1 phosphatase PAP2 family protein [Mesorhizobium sp. WSM4982]MDG4915157.1 phosphatase PAP2 family protein [Mesorhizobium sp. WSM4983]
MEMASDIAAERSRFSVSAKLAVFGLCYAGLAAYLFPVTYFSALGTGRLKLLYLLLPFLILIGLIVAAVISQPRAPASWLRYKLASRGPGATITLGIFILCLAAFTAYKHEFSQLVPFFADQFLARIDTALHFGAPWRWARAVPVPDVADRALYMLYSQLWFVVLAAVVVVAAWLDDAPKRQRYFLSLITCAVILGMAVRLAASSAGPIFYDRLFDPDMFEDLIRSLKASDSGPDTLRITDYLYSSYTAHKASIGTGISAMPSFHVAIAVLNALFLSSLNRRVGAVAWIYAGIILFGSVYFGWHYAIDGYFSIIATAVIWRQSGRRIGGGAGPSRWAP